MTDNPLPGTDDLAQLLFELQGDKGAEAFAASLDTPRATYWSYKHQYRYPSEAFIGRLLAAYPERSEEIVAAYGQIPPRGQRRHRSRQRALSPRASTFQLSIVEMVKAGRAAEARAGILAALAADAPSENRIWLLDQLADLEFAAGNFSAGVEAWESGLAFAVADGLEAEEIEIRLRLASRLGNAEKYPDALAILDEGLARHPFSGRLWRRRGLLCWHDGRLPEAFACLKAAETYGVKLDDILYVRGQVFADWGQYERAVTDLSEALRRKATTPLRAAYVRTTRAHAYARLGKTKRALREFAAAELVTPRNGWLHYFKALCQREIGDHVAAIESLNRALGADAPPLTPLKREAAVRLLSEWATQ